jgi:hypothetical protein
MINSDPVMPPGGDPDERIDGILRSGARGALTVAGIATIIVVAIWFAFYFLVFMPRAVVP